MNRILAIAGLTLRSAIRSKVLALLVVLVMSGIIGLPLIMKSDGSLAGQVQLFMEYTLGLTVTLLSVIAVWTGAGAVSLEVENRQIQLVTVKPVRALELWAGKWLALMVIDGILLALAGAMIYGLLWWTTRPAIMSAEDRAWLRENILVAHTEVLPEPRQTVAPGAASIPTVAPGKSWHWQFNPPRGVRAGEEIFLQYRFVTSHPDLRAPVAGLWLIDIDGKSRPIEYPASGLANHDYSFRIPAPEGSRRLDISYVNMDQATPVTLLFDASGGVKLRVNVSRFEANYLRALLIILARLAFFSALGLTAGAVFSFPVAVFVSLALLLMSVVNHWMLGGLTVGLGIGAVEAAVGTVAAIVNRVIQFVLLALNAILPPLYRYNPLEFLPDGILISWGLIGKAWLLLVGVYSGMLALVGAWWFSRRELGLPAE
jgi:hypothetical protein